MNMAQIAAVVIIIVLALSHAGYRIYKALRAAGDPCYGCAGCAIHDQLLKKRKEGSKKPACFNKKQ